MPQKQGATGRLAMRVLFAVMVLAFGLVPYVAWAETPVLSLTFDGKTQTYTAAELLARSDAATIEIPADVTYKRAMTYRAVPLLALLGDVDRNVDTIEAAATDGFVSQIPMGLVRKGADAGAVAWVAVEDPKAPWPPLGDKDASAGPFYLVWEHPERSNVGSEQWPYQLASLTGVESPAHRWPQIAVDAGLPADAPERRGEAVFTVQCMPCHKMKGGGAADVGPDLGEPMGPTQYMTMEGLRRLIRDPASVRTWPERRMQGFDEKTLSDDDLDAVIAYLAHMAPTQIPPAR